MSGERILDLREDRTSVMLRARTGGELVLRGKLVISITDDDHARVDAAIAMADAASLHVGMAVRVMLDSYAFRRQELIDGRITYLAAQSASGIANARPAYCLVSVRLQITGAACADA